MCAIAGFIQNKSAGESYLAKTASAMAATMQARGPDDGGEWVDGAHGVAFSHRRLSVIDLSANGHQPMASSCGRFVITYNGEIYNFPDIKKQLQQSGISFKGHSDTEVLLEAVARFGVEKTLEKLVGMFAFALWDKKTGELTLARDRLGIKPLYWAVMGGVFMFASELKALKAHPAFKGEISKSALANYLRHAYVPAPLSIYEHVFKLLPGHYLSVHAEGDFKPQIKQYWSLYDVAAGGISDPVNLPDEALIDETEKLLGDAIKLRMVSDVPLGALLSGGIDSTAVVALMQEQSANKINTFSIGFGEKGFDESVHAAKIAKHIGTNHHELFLSSQMALDAIPQMGEIYDEPFADSSQVPTYLVSKLTREHVTVALSGDGGDEVFCGYNRHLAANRAWPIIEKMPRFMRGLGAGAIRSFSPETWDNLFGKKLPQGGDRVYKVAQMLDAKNGDELYRMFVSQWQNPENLISGETGDAVISQNSPPTTSLMNKMRYLDTLTYLPDDILTKVDRASMAVSLEVRVPMIDHRVVEFAWRLPENQLIRDSHTKWPLRRIIERRLPKDLVDRPKQGFSMPIGAWLRGPLKEWASSLLNDELPALGGLINPDPVMDAWREHSSGSKNRTNELWAILMLLGWKRNAS